MMIWKTTRSWNLSNYQGSKKTNLLIRSFFKCFLQVQMVKLNTSLLCNISVGIKMNLIKVIWFKFCAASRFFFFVLPGYIETSIKKEQFFVRFYFQRFPDLQKKIVFFNVCLIFSTQRRGKMVSRRRDSTF